MSQATALDDRNAAFWDELCGTNLARELGVVDASPESLARFDEAYLDLYPYLTGYLPGDDVAGRATLEIGLGYGTVAERLARLAAPTTTAWTSRPGPVAMARARLARVPGARPEQVVQGSVLALPVRGRARSTTSSRSAACTTRATCSAPSPRRVACCGPVAGCC